MSRTRECDSYHPGHNAQPIQVFRGIAIVARPVELISDPGNGSLIVEGRADGAGKATWLFHDLPTVSAALNRWQGGGALLHDHGVLIVGDPDDGSRRRLLPLPFAPGVDRVRHRPLTPTIPPPSRTPPAGCSSALMRTLSFDSELAACQMLPRARRDEGGQTSSPRWRSSVLWA